MQLLGVIEHFVKQLYQRRTFYATKQGQTVRMSEAINRIRKERYGQKDSKMKRHINYSKTDK